MNVCNEDHLFCDMQYRKINLIFLWIIKIYPDQLDDNSLSFTHLKFDDNESWIIDILDNNRFLV